MGTDDEASDPVDSAPSLPTTKSPRAMRHWGNVAAGFSAACALAVSAYTAYLQRQQVRAQVWPILSLGYDAETSEGKEEFRFSLRNDGVGPAIIRGAEVRVDGKPMTDWGHVLHAVAPRPDGPGKATYKVSISTIAGRVLAAGATVNPMSPDEPDVARQFIDAHERIEISLCYCSVLDDCWRLDLTKSDSSEPVPVRTCVKPAVPFEN